MTTARRIILILLSVLSLIALPLSAQQPAPASDKLATLIAEGNDLSAKQFDNAGALAKFTEALALAPNNYEVLWLLSRTLVDIGEHMPAKTDAEKAAQLKEYEKSLDYANKAIAANPAGSMGYTRRAIVNGRVALFKGVWESLDLVKQVRADAEKAIGLDANNAAAYYVLARTHAKVSEKPRVVRWPLGLSWASYDDAAKNFEKAISLRPEFIMYRLDAARTYVELDEYAKAKEQLTKITTLAKADEDDDTFRKEAADLAEKIKNK